MIFFDHEKHIIDLIIHTSIKHTLIISSPSLTLSGLFIVPMFNFALFMVVSFGKPGEPCNYLITEYIEYELEN